MAKRILVGAVFLVGCAVGGASSQLVLPKASAQQAATLHQWEYYCIQANDDEVHAVANKLGTQAWELAASGTHPHQPMWCFKRPKL